MKIREVIVENDEEDMFGHSDRVGNDLRRATYQQRIPAMVKMIQGNLEANAGPFVKQMAAELGRDADVFRRDPEIFDLADDLLTQEVMPQVTNILLSLDPAVITDEDTLNDALTDHVANIRNGSDLWIYIEEILNDGEDAAYMCAMTIEGEIGALLLKLIQQAYTQSTLAEAFDKPYKTKSEKSDYGDVDMLAKLPDGTNLSIMFSQEYGDQGEEVVQVEFYRNNSQDVTGEGDAQRIFATVLDAIQKYIKKYKPKKLSFSASKEVDMDADDVERFNPESRAKLYDRLVQRYARAWGYRAFRADNGDIVIYELSRLKPAVAEGKQPGKPVVDAILKVMPVTQEIWFHGSRATGQHRKNSDTDILVVIPDDLVGDQYLSVVRILQKLSSHFDNYDIQPTRAGTNIHRIAQEEGRLLWSSKQGVAEAPLADYVPMGDFNKPGPFRGADKKLVPHPVNQLKAQRFFEKTPYNFRLFFSNIPGTGKYSEYGVMDPDTVKIIFGDAGEQIVAGHEDAITVVYVGNSGDSKVMLTPWMMAHRLGHAMQSGTRGRSNNQQHPWKAGEDHFFGQVNSMLEEYYGKSGQRGGNLKAELTPEYNALFNAIGTQRSSRSGEIRRPYEFLYEIFAQYLGTGTVTFNALPANLGYGRKAWGNPSRYLNINPEYRDEAARKQATEVLSYDMELMFNDALSNAEGKILVM